MEELESQIAKIQLGNNKSSTSYVYVMAEKAPAGETELYLVAELPLLNPAAQESYERICQSIASTFRRCYRKSGAENNFENCIGQINEELGKQAASGQTAWIDKLNCILGVKQGTNFSIASCGKVSAYLIRNQEVTDISCSQEQSHPLKTFENYAVGKIRLGDLLLLSTTQLFNYLSLDRILSIVDNTDFLSAAQAIISLLKQNAESSVSFGVVLNLQVPMGQQSEPDMDLANYIAETPEQTPGLPQKAWAYLTTAFKLSSFSARAQRPVLPSVPLAQRLKNASAAAKNLWSKIITFWEFSKASAKTVRTTVNVQNFRELSPQKKFFLASAVILAVAVFANIAIAVHLKKVKSTQGQASQALKQTQTDLANAQSSLLYKDDAGAANYFQKAKAEFPSAQQIDQSNKALYAQVLKQLQDVQSQMEKDITATVTNLGSLGHGDSLIKLPEFLANQVNAGIVSYNKTTGQVRDSALTLPVTLVSSVYLSGQTAAVYNGSQLYLWNYSAGSVGPGFTQNVPAKNDFAGIAEYPVNNRVYIADKNTASIISFLPTKDSFAKPVVSVRDQSLTKAVDITIDGSIYVLSQTGVTKFQNGQLTNFAFSNLALPLSGSGKIYTQKDFKNIYILDAGNNRILVVDKQGQLLHTLKSPSFTKLKDFQIDEKNKLMFVLNDGSLLKVILP